jgi:hypothetical protein
MFKLGSRSSWAAVRLGYGAADRQPQAPASLLGARAARGEAALHHNALHPSALEYERSRRWGSGQRGSGGPSPGPACAWACGPHDQGSPSGERIDVPHGPHGTSLAIYCSTLPLVLSSVAIPLEGGVSMRRAHLIRQAPSDPSPCISRPRVIDNAGALILIEAVALALPRSSTSWSLVRHRSGSSLLHACLASGGASVREGRVRQALVYRESRIQRDSIHEPMRRGRS